MGVLTAAVALIVAALAFVVVSGAETAGRTRHLPSRPEAAMRLPGSSAGPSVPSSGPSPGASSRPPAPWPATRLFTALPQACVVVPPATVRRLVPAATIVRDGGTADSTCTYSVGAGTRHRELRVRTQIFTPDHSRTPVEDAKGAMVSRWKLARRGPGVRTERLEYVTGLGDEAFQRYVTDQRRPTVTAEVVMRVRNSLAVVSYVEDAPDGDRAGKASQRRCLLAVGGVAREILPAFE